MEDSFRRIGIDETNIKNLMKNAQLSEQLQQTIEEANLGSEGCDKSVGALLYAIATRLHRDGLRHRPLLVRYVRDRKIRINVQIEAALEFAKKKGPGVDIEATCLDEFHTKCGVGIEISREQIRKAISDLLQVHMDKLKAERYTFNVGPLFGQLRKDNLLKWADGNDVNDEMNAQIKEILGERTAEDDDMEKNKANKKKPAPAAPTKAVSPQPTKEDGDKKQNDDEKKKEVVSSENGDFDEMEKFVGRELEWAKNTPQILEQHRNATEGKIMTRFPPEPNGFLHIGHAKAMNLSFGLARKHNGHCYLRFDDTNPTAEKIDYIHSIKDTVAWLGHKPWKVTYTSDYFSDLHSFAIQLIKKGLAYVDHQTPDEMSKYREEKRNSPWRDRPVEENLRLFMDMSKGKFDEGSAILRLKMDMQHDNPNMRDLVAYRIKFSPHPHVGDKWCVYPSYDYSHPIVDSLENITHSLCSLEFEVRRENYYWVLWALDLYRPMVWEFSRLNLTSNVMSKRKLNKLVTEKYVHDWDDPRLMTVMGLRRRGYTAEAINRFCDQVGVTRHENVILIQVLEHFARQDLDQNAPRAFCVLNPLKVTISNWPLDRPAVTMVQAPIHPARPEMGTREMPLSRVLYIEQSDFRVQDSKDYYGLAPSKEVALRYAGVNITCSRAVQDTATGAVLELVATANFAPTTKPKGVLHWVAEPQPGVAPLTAELRLYDRLFLTDDPASDEKWLETLNPNSEVVVPDAFVEPNLRSVKHFDKFQFERTGYFSVDPDTAAPERLVFNRTVSLKESKEKQVLKTNK